MSDGRLTATVVVPTRNRGELIGETIQALLKLRCDALDILVVDQSTDDVTGQTVVAVAGGDARVRYRRSNTIGSSAARNAGALVSRTDIVAYTDDDCIVTDGWLQALLQGFADPQVVGVYGRLLPHAATERTGTEVGLKDAGVKETYRVRTPPWHIGHGGNMAFRRDALLAAGGFDPLLGAGCLLRSGEDADIAYRLLAKGHSLVYAPAALAYHKHWKSWGAQKRMERAYGIGMGAQVAKHVRCGDNYGLRLLLIWLYELGLRRVGSGLLKWKSRKVMYLGYCQLLYPWIGLWQARRYGVDCHTICYRLPAGEARYDAFHAVRAKGDGPDGDALSPARQGR